MQDYDKLKNEVLIRIKEANSLDDLENLRVQVLGKKGIYNYSYETTWFIGT
jgi:hypothetical protein